MPNNREWALLAWLAVLAVFVLASGSMRTTLGSITRTILGSKIGVVLGLMVAYVVGLVAVGHEFGVWSPALATATVIWFIAVGIVLLFKLADGPQPGFYRQVLAGLVAVAFVLEFFVNIVVFPVVVELVLLPLLVFLGALSAYAASKVEYAQVHRLVEFLLVMTGLIILVAAVVGIARNWHDLSVPSLAVEFFLPVWLTIGFLPFLATASVYVSYDFVYVHVRADASGFWPRWRAMFALASVARFQFRYLRHFNTYWSRQLATARTFREVRHVVGEFVSQEEARRRQEEAEAERLVRLAGAAGTDDEWRQLDRREFEETRTALTFLSTCQMGWYRIRGGKYRPELWDFLDSRFARGGLPEDHGVHLVVTDDGQSWYAWRRTVTGWCFAIGAVGPPPNQSYYDGPESPGGFPGSDPCWGEQWDAANW